ncbi:MAG: transcription repressor NadR [Eubacterium sp.]|nr:transcription repressor NadR [Eubacterium sp.]
MNGEQRRNELLSLLTDSRTPISGAVLAQKLQVSRQVIVQDIALLRANGADILSASRGYLMLHPKQEARRVFKVVHTDAQTEEELTMIVDLGGIVRDVFIYHRVYGIVCGEMKIRSRRDIQDFMEKIRTGKSSLLKNVTSGYHYHTIAAEDTQTLDAIWQKLAEKGMLAKLQEDEPVDFWSKMQG